MQGASSADRKKNDQCDTLRSGKGGASTLTETQKVMVNAICRTLDSHFRFYRNTQTISRSVCTSVAIGLCLNTLLYSPQAKAVINLQVQQIGPDVVISGSGKANLSALTLNSTNLMYQNVLTDVQIYAGPNQPNAGQVNLYNGITSGPATISSDPFLVELPDQNIAASYGDLFGIVTNPFTLVLPKGYVSNADLSGISTIQNHTISGLGLTVGTSSWTWGSMANGDFDSINLTVPNSTPVPGPLPLAGGAALFGWSRKLRKRSRSLDFS